MGFSFLSRVEFEIVRGGLDVLTYGQDWSSNGAECDCRPGHAGRTCRTCQYVDRFINFYRDFQDGNKTKSK